MVDLGTAVTVVLAGSGAAVTAAHWAVRIYVKSQVEKVNNRIATHEREDRIIHANVAGALDDLKTDTRTINAKLDRLIERL